MRGIWNTQLDTEKHNRQLLSEITTKFLLSVALGAQMLLMLSPCFLENRQSCFGHKVKAGLSQ